MFKNAQIWVFLIALLLAPLMSGCGDEETTEDHIRTYIDQVAASAQDRDWRAFGGYIADVYADARSFTKQEILGIITRYILANQRIHIFKRVANIQVHELGHASAVVYAAMAGQRVTSANDLALITADIYRFDIDLATDEAGELQVTRADWKPVPMEDFLSGE